MTFNEEKLARIQECIEKLETLLGAYWPESAAAQLFHEFKDQFEKECA